MMLGLHLDSFQFAMKEVKKALFRLDFAMEEMCFAVNGKNLRKYLKTALKKM